MADTSNSQLVEAEPEFPYPGNQTGNQGTPPPPVDAPGIEEAPEQPGQASEPETPEGEQPEPEELEPETVTITKGGREYVIPKELEEDILFQADYTKKTQAVAEQRKALEAEQEAQAVRVKVQQEHLADVAKLHALDTEIVRLTPIVAGHVQVQSQEEYQQAANALMFYRGQREDIAKQVEIRVSEAQREAHESAEKRRTEAQEYATRNIPNWTPEMEKNVRTFAEQQGVPSKLIEQAVQASPATLKILHLANVGQQFLDSQRKANRPQKKPVKIPKVGSGGSAPSTGPTDDMSAEDWVAARNRQLAAKRGRAR